MQQSVNTSAGEGAHLWSVLASPAQAIGGGLVLAEHTKSVIEGSHTASPVLPPPDATVGFGASSVSTVRGTNRTPAVFTVIRTGPAHTLSKLTVVHFTTLSNGSAVEGVDFVLPQRSVAFGPNETTAEVVVVILEHRGVDLKPRTFQIILTAVENGTLGMDGRVLTVTIISSQSKLCMAHACEEGLATSW